MKEQTKVNHKPFLHNPFLVILFSLVMLLSLFSVALIVQALLGYQKLPPLEFLIIPLLGAAFYSLAIEMKSSSITVRVFGVRLWQREGITWEWRKLKEGDKVESVCVTHNEHQYTLPIVQKVATKEVATDA